ncbi:hypothetical protein [Microbacterium testaceum]|uniref:hypothetical protein n=1 Tax=Microbacterium testaceum TaxID=2033 RepID=UPI0022E7EC00|nr:hypothetical protein [Microbacterium testaceum]
MTALVLMSSPDDSLYRCSFCETWWTGNSRFRNPVAVRDADARFPGNGVASSPAVDDAKLSDAIVRHTGWGVAPEPTSDLGAVAARFGDEAQDLIPVL